MNHRTLIIDCTLDPSSFGCHDLRRLVAEAFGGRSTLVTRRAPHGDLPAIEHFDQIVVSGSRASPEAGLAWIFQLKEFIREVLARSIPYLGICFGHQILASILGGSVKFSSLPQIGWTSITTKPCRLFEGVPETFVSFSHHFEEVSELPSDTQVLAYSRHCGLEAIQWKELPVYGIQFHPEKTCVQAQAILAKFQHLCLGEAEPSFLWGAQIFRNAFHI